MFICIDDGEILVSEVVELNGSLSFSLDCLSVLTDDSDSHVASASQDEVRFKVLV